MDIKILNIEYEWKIEDLYIEDLRERTFQMRGYKVEYYLNNYIRSTIEIGAERELTIDEIKQKIRETYRSTVVEGE